VADADVIVTATTATTPLFPESAAKRGSLVIALGSGTELDPALVLGADKLVVDSVDQNVTRGQFGPLFRSGELTPGRLHAELGDIVAASAAGRESSNERIVAALIGMSTEDIALAARVWRVARDRGIGQRFSFLA
jgi:ornithine cyclodeaminase